MRQPDRGKGKESKDGGEPRPLLLHLQSLVLLLLLLLLLPLSARSGSATATAQITQEYRLPPSSGRLSLTSTGSTPPGPTMATRTSSLTVSTCTTMKLQVRSDFLSRFVSSYFFHQLLFYSFSPLSNSRQPHLLPPPLLFSTVGCCRPTFANLIFISISCTEVYKLQSYELNLISYLY